MATRMATKRMKKNEYWKRKHGGDESTMSAMKKIRYQRRTLICRTIVGGLEQKYTLDGYTDDNEMDDKKMIPEKET